MSELRKIFPKFKNPTVSFQSNSIGMTEKARIYLDFDIASRILELEMNWEHCHELFK